MRLDDLDTDVNVEDQRGRGGGGFGFPSGGGGLPLGRSMGCGTFLLIIVAALIFGVNPMQILGGDANAPTTQVAPQGATGKGCDADAASRFSCQVLRSNNLTWNKQFTDGSFREPKIVFYAGGGQSGCGAAQSAMGPFYCPTDEGIYLDTAFYQELSQRFGAAGDFAQAYVIAHEVGHHIQKLTGIADQVQSAQQRASRTEGNQLQVAMELQADCYAGVWAAQNRERMEPGDVEEGLRAAHQIGDDVLQRQSQGVVVPESFTHGSAEQRMSWLKRGLESGDPERCDTFGR
jgi:predicted metalloprotease